MYQLLSELCYLLAQTSAKRVRRSTRQEVDWNAISILRYLELKGVSTNRAGSGAALRAGLGCRFVFDMVQGRRYRKET